METAERTVLRCFFVAEMCPDVQWLMGKGVFLKVENVMDITIVDISALPCVHP